MNVTVGGGPLLPIFSDPRQPIITHISLLGSVFEMHYFYTALHATV